LPEEFPGALLEECLEEWPEEWPEEFRAELLVACRAAWPVGRQEALLAERPVESPAAFASSLLQPAPCRLPLAAL